MPLKSFTNKYLNESDNTHTLEINEFLNFSIDHRMAFVNLLFFVDNRTQEVLYNKGLRIKVIRTRKLDLGFMMLTDYKSSGEQNELIVEFLDQNNSYWSIDIDNIKINTNLVLDHRKSVMDKIARYFEVRKADIFY
ncbi:MAG: hypothetical protein ACC656_06015 [Candidatus Heimdallarchaeota archaeon]